MAVRAFSKFRAWTSPAGGTGNWGDWTIRESGSAGVYCYYLSGSGMQMAETVAFQLPGYGSGTQTSVDLALSVKVALSESMALTCYLLNYNPTGSQPVQSYISSHALAKSTVYVNSTSFQTKTFSFSGFSVDAGATLFAILGCEGDGFRGEVQTLPQGLSALSMDINPGSIDLGDNTTISFSNRYGLDVSLTYKRGSTLLATGSSSSDSITVTPTQSWFTNAGGSLTSMSVTVTATNGVSTATGNFTLTKPVLSFSLSPDPYATGKPMTVYFQNRGSQTVTLTFTRSGTTVHTISSISSDSVSFTPTDSWLASGATSSSISIKATDTLNRTATGSFTLKKSATVSNLVPRNTTRTATASMTYSWDVTGGTTQTSATVYVNGNPIGSVTGSTTSLTSSYKPAPGTVSWYVEVTNNLGITTTSSTVSFTLNYSATSYINPYNSTTSGYIRRDLANSFSVQILASGVPYQPFRFSAAPTFYWKMASSSTYNSIAMTLQSADTAATVTIGANTFPSADINWYVSGTDNTGTVRTTTVYTINARYAPITCTPIAPVETIENRNTPTVFRWSTSGALSSPQAVFEIGYSTDRSSWTVLIQQSSSSTSYEAPAQALPSGTIYWRVRAQNKDYSWGSYSAIVSYTNFGAPVVTDLIADGRPRTTISWNVSNQQAYRVTVDGTVYGPFFGASVRSFQIPDYLADGVHTASVEAQNEYGQWSAPYSEDFQVTNVPGTEVKLSGLLMRDAELRWSGGDSQDFFVYRDGVRIGHAGGYEFTDRTVLGWHEWFVLNPRAGGYYTKSNTISGTLCSGSLMIAPLAGGEWLDLGRSSNSDRAVTYSFAQNISIRQVAGQEWPEAEASPYKTLSCSFDIAWPREEKTQADAFAALVGKPVILKDPQEGAFVGILTAWTRAGSTFYRAFSATVQRIRWEEYVNEDG